MTVPTTAARQSWDDQTLRVTVVRVALVVSALLGGILVGQAAMSMQLAAADLGIGTGHSAVRDKDLCRRLLKYPKDRTCDYLIVLGYPADRPLRPLREHKRRPFESVAHFGRW